MRSGARLLMTSQLRVVHIATMFHSYDGSYCRSHSNQIGSACAGSNPAVRALNKCGRARVVKGFDSNE